MKLFGLVKKLYVQVAQTADAIKRPPENLSENLRNEYVNAVELRSGKTLHSAAKTMIHSEKAKEQAEERSL